MEQSTTEEFLAEVTRIQKTCKTGEVGIDVRFLLIAVGMAAMTDKLTTIHNVLKQLSKQLDQQRP